MEDIIVSKKTPFYDVGVKYGAKMAELFGYWLPAEYATGHAEEYIGTRTRASLCDLDYMAVATIKGPDAFAYIQKVFTNDFTTLGIGGIRYTAIPNEQGNMVDDGTCWHTGENEYMFISGDESDYAWLEKNAEGFDIELTNITDQWTTLALQGPLSRKILEKLTDVDLGFKFYTFKKGKVGGVDCTIARIGFTGEFGYEIHFSSELGTEMWEKVMAAGKEEGIVPCGQLALESLRQEAGMILVGNEHNKTINPFEASIGWTVKLGKTNDFNGQQALKEIIRNGVTKTLVWFRVDGIVEAKTGDPIFSGEKEISYVTSGSMTPGTDHNTALGYVRPEYTITGSHYTICSDGTGYDAALSLVPLYDPGKYRRMGKNPG